MANHQPSRRQLLGGLLVGLFAWLRPAKSQAAAPRPKPEPVAQPLPPGSVTIYTYDALGRRISESDPWPYPTDGTAYVYDARGGLTTYTYER